MKIKRCETVMKFARYIRSDEGAVAVVMGMLLPLLVGMGGVGIDVGHLIQQKRLLQTAVDAAARAGAHEIANGRSEDDAVEAAIQEAEINGGTVTLTADDIEFPDNEENGKHQVVVYATKSVDVWLSNMFVTGGVTAAATATAEVSADGRFCLLSLNTSVDDAIVIAGSADVQANGCGIAINSSSETALNLNGNPVVNAGEIKIAGDTAEELGGNFTADTLLTNTTQTADPYADLEIQPFDGCSQAEADAGGISPNSSAEIPDPADTGGVAVICGDFELTSNTDYVLPAGTYIIDGGDFRVSSGGSIDASAGVTIILTDSTPTAPTEAVPDPPSDYGTIDITGNKDMYFKAPSDGDYAGIAFYQDRNTPASADNNDRNKITGGGGLTLDGLLYAPSRPVEYGGNTASSLAAGETCSKIIANTISLSGNPDMGTDCEDSGTAAIGVGIVTLVN